MKVVVLGGAGGMGRYAARAATTLDAVSDVVVADLDGSHASSFADSIGASARAVDVSDEASLAGAIGSCDVVLNCVGPFYRFGVTVLRAAIAAGARYLDICDDPEPTIEMLDLHDEAARAGVTAVIGVGASPGVSNLLAVRAMRELDTVESVITAWSIAGTGAEPTNVREGRREPSAAVVHWVQQCTGTIRVARNGRMVDVPPLEELEIDYPGIGRGRGWTVGHPEAITLPRSRPELANSSNVMVGARDVVGAMRALGADVDAGTSSVADAAARLVNGEVPDAPVDASPRDDIELPPLFAHATGTRDGRPASSAAMVLAMPPKGMGGATGVPLAVGMSQLLAMADSPVGVFAPEDVFDPDAFFDEIGRHCVPARTGAEMVLVTTSDTSPL